MVGVRDYEPLHPALMKWFMATETGFQMQKFECRSPKYPHAMLEVLIVPLLKPDAAHVRSPGWLVVVEGEAGAHQLLFRSSPAPIPVQRLLAHGARSVSGQPQTRILRPLGSDKEMEMIHFDFITGLPAWL